MARKRTAYHINNSDHSYMCLKQQLENKLKITFASPSENSEEKNKEKKIVAKLFPLHANEKNFEKIKN